jgi:HlyD family secretion protein
MDSPKPKLDDLRIERRPEAVRRARVWPTVIAICVLLVVGAFGLWLHRARPIEVQTVVAREAATGPSAAAEHTVLNASGYVTARRQATVSAKVTGKVMAVLFEEGMKVKENQELARLDDTNVKTSLDVAEAQLVSAKVTLQETQASLKQADLEFHRVTNLAKQNIASQSDLDLAEANAMTLKARLARQEKDVTTAERQVALWQQQMEDMIIRAPFDGIVTTKDAQPGEMISPISAGGGFTRTGIGTIVDMTSLEIEIDVNESYINRVEPGQPVEATLDAYPEWKIPCKVIAIIPTADRQKSTVKVRVGFDKLDPRILPEMSVKVAFHEVAGPGPAARTVTVPKSAVRQQDGRDVVLVVQDGHAKRRTVTIAGTTGDDATVATGLAAGERVALDWPQTLADGAPIREKR